MRDKQERQNPLLKPPKPAHSTHWDHRLPLAKRRPPRTTLKLTTPGVHQERAEEERRVAQLEQLRREVAEVAKETGLDMSIVKDLLQQDAVPLSEWWDTPFLNDKLVIDANLHDPPIVHQAAEEPVPIKPLFLTPAERKKMRRQRRLAEQREKQERIKAGLQPPDPPKLKLATLARLTNNADSVTEMERTVREAAAARQATHQASNEQRSAEATCKDPRQQWSDPNDPLVHVAIFTVTRLDKPEWQFKVKKNARQTYLTGCALLLPANSNFILVEGSAKSIRHYQRLMLHRIKWEEAECRLLWEGTQPTRKFHTFELQNYSLELEATDYLTQHQAEHYWNLIKK